jgi:Tfp pilus assembly protein PilF
MFGKSIVFCFILAINCGRFVHVPASSLAIQNCATRIFTLSKVEGCCSLPGTLDRKLDQFGQKLLVLRGGASTSTCTLTAPQDSKDSALNASIDLDDQFNETKLVELFNTASDCDTLELMYQKVLSRNPVHVPTLHNYGNLLMKVRQNFSEAEIRYKQALIADPQHVPSLCNYGNLLHNHLSKPDVAETMYIRALEIDPAHATTLCNYGLFVQNVKRDPRSAENWYKKALESDPHHSTTLYNYGRLLQVILGSPLLYKPFDVLI